MILTAAPGRAVYFHPSPCEWRSNQACDRLSGLSGWGMRGDGNQRHTGRTKPWWTDLSQKPHGEGGRNWGRQTLEIYVGRKGGRNRRRHKPNGNQWKKNPMFEEGIIYSWKLDRRFDLTQPTHEWGHNLKIFGLLGVEKGEGTQKECEGALQEGRDRKTYQKLILKNTPKVSIKRRETVVNQVDDLCHWNRSVLQYADLLKWEYSDYHIIYYDMKPVTATL